MAEPDSEPKRARPPLPSRGVMEPLERWVSDLEREAPFRPREPETSRSRNGAIPTRREPDHTADIRAAREEIRLEGLVATLPPGDARIVLEREGDRLVHRGTVGIRGPCAPTRAELIELGLTRAQATALEFTLAWFASPLDHLTWEPAGGAGRACLRWGAWPLSGTAIVECLAHWKRRAPDTFEARLGRLGIDARPRQPSSPPSLTLLELERGHPTQGQKALRAWGGDLRLLAALAQAGRERGAQLAQFEYLSEHVLRPALVSPPQGTSPLNAPGGPFSTPRALALLLHAELRVGRRGVARLVTHARDTAGQRGSEALAGQRFAADLQAVGRTREACEVQRILSSPELAGAPAP